MIEDTIACLIHPAPRPRARTRSWSFRIPGWEAALFILALLGLWQGVTTWVKLPNPALFPSIPVTLRALWSSLPELLKGTWYSFRILVPGYFGAVALGIAAAPAAVLRKTGQKAPMNTTKMAESRKVGSSAMA